MSNFTGFHVNMPGSFPGSSNLSNMPIPEESVESDQQSNIFTGFMRAPSSMQFNFSPTHQMSVGTGGTGSSLYPSFDKPLEQTHHQGHLGSYSKKVNNDVLSELDKRAATKIRSTSHLSNKSVLSPRSSRFNSSHRAKFQKMESISTHYSTIRCKPSSGNLRREEVEMEKENVEQSYDPNTKRSGLSILGSASKRRRTATGRQEIVNDGSKLTKSPSKATLHHESTPSRTLPHSSSSSVALNKPTIPQSRTVSQNISGLTSARQLPRSSTLQNLTKPTASSIQRSASNKNLGQTLRSQQSTQTLRPQPSSHSLRPKPSLGNLSSSISSSSTSTSHNHTLPRAKSTMNLKQSAGNKPVWR